MDVPATDQGNDPIPVLGTLTFSAEGQSLGRAALSCISELESAVAAVRETKRRHSVAIATTPSFAVRWLVPDSPRSKQYIRGSKCP